MSNEVKDFFSTYSDFVKKVTSEPSLDMDALKNSLRILIIIQILRFQDCLLQLLGLEVKQVSL